MFKRVLVLVLFLFGVFWWLTHRGGDEPQEPTSDIVTVETVEGEEATEGETDEEKEGGDDEKSEDEKEEAVKIETVSTTTPVVTTTTVPATVLTPATPVTAPVITAPVVIQPSIPVRTTDVKVYAYEWNMDLSDKTIPAGTVNFKVQNDGRFTHDFNISGFGNLGKVMPSETKTFTVKLKAGEYEAFSKRRQDYERGVKETFTITP